MRDILIISFLFSGSVFAQEFVNNGDFENYIECPSGVSQLAKAEGWFTFGLSPEYFNTCATHDAVLVPSNTSGYQEPSSGNAYAGMIPIYGVGSTQREFLGNELVMPLTIGQTYDLSFKVSLAFNEADITGRACSHMGAKLSTVPYSEFSAPTVDNFAHIYTESIIDDTTNWVTISGTVEADSAYKYIIIGNFFSEAIFDTVNVGTEDFNRVYYYVEDVSVKTSGHSSIGEEQKKYQFKYDANNKIASLSPSSGDPFEKVEIFSMTGELIHSIEAVDSYEVQINCSQYKSGVYILRFQNSNKEVDQIKFAL